MTHRELEARITSSELSEWMAYTRLEPLPADRAEYMAAVIATTFANAHRKKNARPFKLSDFLPQWDQPDRSQTPEQMLAIVVEMNKALKGRDLRGKSGDSRQP